MPVYGIGARRGIVENSNCGVGGADDDDAVKSGGVEYGIRDSVAERA